MPSLNFSINYRKHCTPKITQIKTSTSKKSNSSFLIAYITIGTLVGFSFLIFLTACIMCIKNKYKIKKLNTQYEALKIKNGNNANLHVIPVREYKSSHSKRHDYFKHEQSNSDNQLITSDTNTKIISKQQNFVKNNMKKTRQLKQQYNNNGENANTKNEDNLYESLHEASVNVYLTQSEIYNENEDNTSKKYSRISKGGEKQYLNMTTNTIQSTCNTTINNVSIVDKRSNVNNLELCVRFKRDLIVLGKVYLEGTFSKIYDGILKREDNNQEEIKVFIKIPNDYASNEQIDIMLKESSFMRGLKHKNITSILGVCIDENHDDSSSSTSQSQNKPMALFNYCEIGNLKVYLTQMRLNNKNKHNFVLPNTAQLNSNEQVCFILLLLDSQIKINIHI
jgi:hypothetical protein